MAVYAGHCTPGGVVRGKQKLLSSLYIHSAALLFTFFVGCSTPGRTLQQGPLLLNSRASHSPRDQFLCGHGLFMTLYYARPRYISVEGVSHALARLDYSLA